MFRKPQWHTIRIASAANAKQEVIATDYIPEILEGIDLEEGHSVRLMMNKSPDISPDANKVDTATIRGRWQAGHRGGFYAVAVMATILLAAVLFLRSPDLNISVDDAAACVAEQSGEFSRGDFNQCLGLGRRS